jgi:hypothetical protein
MSLVGFSFHTCPGGFYYREFLLNKFGSLKTIGKFAVLLKINAMFYTNLFLNNIRVPGGCIALTKSFR